MRVSAVVFIGLLSAASASPLVAGTPTRVTRDATAVQEQVSLCSQYAYYSANGYEVLNNLWGKDAATSGSQCTYYDGGSSSGIQYSSTWTWRGGENNVKSYIYAGKILQKGMKVANVKSMQTTMNWNYNTTNGVRANVAYDVFTAADPNHVNSSGDFELMIWLARIGSIYPIGTVSATVTIAGQSWELWAGYNGSMRVYSFVRAGADVKNFSADVKLFFNYLVQNYQYPASQQNLIVFQTGTEAFTGGPAKFTVSQFSVNIST